METNSNIGSSTNSFFAAGSKYIGNGEEERPESFRRTALWVLLSGACYYLATQIAWALCFPNSKVSLFFPPHAVLVSVLLLVPTRHWWAYTLAAVGGHFLATQQAHWPFFYSLHCEAFDAVQNVATAAGLRIFIKSPLKLITLRDAIVFVLVAVVIVPFGTAFWGAAFTISNHFGTHYWVEWRNLGISNAVTATVLVPAILLGVHQLTARRIKVAPARLLEACLLGAGLLTVAVFAFDHLPAGPDTSPALLYAPIPLLVWAALRFGLGGTCASMVVITFLAIWGTMHGKGPFLMQSPAGNALELQMFLLFTATPLMFLGVVIEEEKRSQSALYESESRFRTVANTAPVMIWMSGADKLCDFFNKGWLDFRGRTLEAELGNGWVEGVHTDDRVKCLKCYADSFDARRPFTMEYRLRRHDGEYRWITDHGVPRYGSAQIFLGYIGTCLDITERKRAEAKFRLAVEASPNGIVLADREDRILLVNAETERLFGYTREELVGHAVEMLLPEQLHGSHPSHRFAFPVPPQARIMDTRRELFARRKDGTEFPVEIGLSPIQSEEGLLVLTAIVDITARKRAEAEAQQQRAELTHLSRVNMLGELAGSLAHELNQPLTAVLSNAQAAQRFLAHDQPNLNEVREILADIVAEDKRAGEIIRRLRSLLKKGEVQHQPLNMNEIVHEVLKLVRSDLLNQNFTAQTDLAPDLPKLRGDRVQLQQVLLNLVMNACDAMAGAARDHRQFTIQSGRDGDDSVRVSVADCGAGIDPEKLEQVFEPFYTTKPHGLGLGLAVCRTIISAHGGKLWATRNSGRGATFHFSLPKSRKEQE